MWDIIFCFMTNLTRLIPCSIFRDQHPKEATSFVYSEFLDVKRPGSENVMNGD